MSDGFWSIILAVGVVQGVFLSGALALKTTANPKATRTLAALVGVFTLLILGEALEVFIESATGLLIASAGINVELAIGPLLLLLVRFVLDPDRSWRRSDSVHFLPLAAGLAAWLGLQAAVLSGRLALSDDQLRAAVAVFVTFKAGFLYVYLGRALVTLRRGLERIERFTAGRRAVEMRWLSWWLAGLGVAACPIYVSFYLSHFGWIAFDSDNLGSLILGAMIYLVSLTVLLRPWLLSVRPRSPQEERFAEEAARLREILEGERPYLDPDLGLRELAEALGTSENRLSAVINQGLGTSFYDLLNRYRLSHFERLAADAALRRRSVLDLAFESGFNSKASFYRVFRRAHGTTPSAFREARLDA